MARQVGKVRPFQLYDAKWHSGLTLENHLANMYFKQPYYASEMVEKMFEASYPSDIINHVNQFPVHKVGETTYRWLGVGMTDKNIPLVGAWEDSAGTIPVGTSTEFIGANGTIFYMDFDEKWFGSKQHIVGNKPDLYRIWILEEPIMVGAGTWRFRVQLTGSDGIFIPKEELALGTRWSGDGGLVSNSLSRDGFGIGFTSPFEFENRMSQFRQQINIPGNMYREGKFSDVYKFKFLDSEGNQHSVWFDSYWYSFLQSTRLNKARKFLYDKSNKLADGTTLNKDPHTGQYADEGAGLIELMTAGNIHPYHPNGLTSDYISKIILDASVTKVPQDKRDITMLAGEYGLQALHKMLRKDLINSTLLPSYMGDTTGRAYKWEGDNKVRVNLGQIIGYADINGIRVSFMHAPQKDDPIRNKLTYELGGRVSSHEFDVMDFGTTGGKPNIQRVELEGQPDIYAMELGIRSAFGNSGTSAKPAVVSTGTDMDVIHYMAWQGAIIWNPTKVIRMIPAVMFR